jgi:hypothetical protein
MCIVLMGYLRFTPVVMAIVVCVVVAGKRVSGWVYILFFGQSGGFRSKILSTYHIYPLPIKIEKKLAIYSLSNSNISKLILYP